MHTRPAVHRTILVVDVAGFGDRRRTNLHQVAVRDGLYRVLTRALLAAGISWNDCDHEDRGDGVLVVIPPSVAKTVLVERLPDELVAALRAHNRKRCAEERIRLRLALHAGEIHYDDHGVVGRAVNLAFRLLDARVLKDALAGSAGVLAIITSSWFFEEVVWHGAHRAGYHRVRVSVKETETTAWICLPDTPTPPHLDETPPAEPQSQVPHQLPAGIRQFAGRDAELGQLAGLLEPSIQDTGMVIITAIDGTAGIGKTTLALYWAQQAKDRFPDGQLHVNLRGFDPASPMEPGQALHGFLQALGVAPSRIPADVDAKAALYRTLVAGRRMLILLDNARSADHVRLLLPGAGRCLVIITSRNRLDSLAVREGAHRIALDVLSTRDAVDLMAKRVDRDRLTAEPGATAELIGLCAGLPLALSIAAARAASHPALPVSSLVRELRDERGRLDALDLGHLDLDLRSVFSWSYRELSADAARLFRQLGLHPGPDIDTHACAALTGAPAAGSLRRLTAAHLLEEHVPQRFRFHDLLRVYASERAAHDEPEPDRTAAIHRVLDHYLRVADLADFHIQRTRDGIIRTTPPEPSAAPAITTYDEAIAWFSAENATLLAAIECAARTGFDSHAYRIALAVTTFLRRSSQRHERVAVHRIGLAAARRFGHRAAEATSLCALARAMARLGQYEEALTHLDAALAISRDIGDRRGEVHALLCFATTLDAQHHHDKALECAEAGWRLADAGNSSARAYALTTMSSQKAVLGRHSEALPECVQGLALHRKIENPEGEASALATLGHIRQGLGQHSQAIACYEQSIDLDRQLGDQYWEASTLDHLGDAYQATGKLTQARQSWALALEIFEALRLPEADTIRSKLRALRVSR